MSLGADRTTMRLQKQLSQRRGAKIYHKYLLVIPNEAIEKLGWGEGQELNYEVRGRSLTLKPS